MTLLGEEEAAVKGQMVWIVYCYLWCLLFLLQLVIAGEEREECSGKMTMMIEEVKKGKKKKKEEKRAESA